MQKEKKWVNDVAKLLAKTMQTELEFYENREEQKICEITIEISIQHADNPIITYCPAGSERKPDYKIWCGLEGERANIYFFEEKMSARNLGNTLKCCIKTNNSFEKIIEAFLEANIVY